MMLTEQDRERIREEEWVRLQAQEDFKRTRKAPPMAGFAIAGTFVVLAAIYFFMRAA